MVSIVDNSRFFGICIREDNKYIVKFVIMRGM